MTRAHNFDDRTPPLAQILSPHRRPTKYCRRDASHCCWTLRDEIDGDIEQISAKMAPSFEQLERETEFDDDEEEIDFSGGKA
jgi:hypothetical protein